MIEASQKDDEIFVIIYYLEKNINRGFGDQLLFEIGPCFIGKKPGQQITVICGVRKEHTNEENYLKKKYLDVYDIKKDVVQTLVELGVDKKKQL